MAAAHFTGRLVLEALPMPWRAGRQLYRLVEDLSFHSALLGGRDLCIPRGFVTDFASMPWWALWFLDDESPAILRASVVHDWLYATCGLCCAAVAGPGQGMMAVAGDMRLTRRQADRVLREAMAASGATRLERWTVYLVVRVVGGFHWGRNAWRVTAAKGGTN